MVNKRLFPRSKTAVFILNILLISIIVGLFSSIVSGIGTRNFYINSEDNVITIVNPAVKTPAVSFIPESIANIFLNMSGVTTVSLETYSLVLIKNSPATLHGITSNFTKLVVGKTLRGKNFANITNNGLALGLFAGKSIASNLGLQVGQSYLIYSTISDSYVSLKLQGIISFNSFYDEELFTSLQNSNFFRPSSAQNDVSMIRIKYNPLIISKNTISNMVNNKHQVTIKLASNYTQNANLDGIKVTVFTIDGFLEDTGTTNGLGVVTFSLPLGHYSIVVSNGPSSTSFDLYVYKMTNYQYNLPKDFNFNPSNYYSLTVRTYKDGIEVFNAHVSLVDYYGNPIIMNKINGVYQAQNLISFPYTITATLRNYTEQQTIYLQSNLTLQVNFTHQVHLQLFNTKNQTINQFSCLIVNQNTHDSVYKQDCSKDIYLPKSVYKIKVIQPDYGNTSITTVIDGKKPIQIINVTIGYIQTNFTFYIKPGILYSSKPVYEREVSHNKFNFLGNTSKQGTISVNFTYGSEYILYLNTSTTHNALYYKSLKSENKIITLQYFRQLTIDVVNGTNTYNRPLANVNVTVNTLYSYKLTTITSIAGLAVFTIPTEDILNITMTQGNFAKNILLYSFNSGDVFTYPLGKTIIQLTLQSQVGLPLSNAKITYVSTTGNKTLQSDATGKVQLVAKSNKNKTSLEQLNLFNSVQFIKDSLRLSYLKENFYVFKVTYFNSSNLIIIPKTYFNSKINQLIVIPFRFIGTFRVIDNFNLGIANAVITLSNQSIPLYSFYTNVQGESNIELYNTGSYSVTIRTQGEIFTQKINIVLNQTSYEIQIPTDTNALKIANTLGKNYFALSSKEYLDSFYNTTLTFFIQLALVLLLIVVIVLLFLFSSAVLLILESIQKEIAITQILGSSNNQMLLNVFFQLSVRALGASILGYILGYLITIVIPNLNSISLIGFIIKPRFDIVLFLLSTVAINFISAITLLRQLQKFNWKTPLEVINF